MDGARRMIEWTGEAGNVCDGDFMMAEDFVWGFDALLASKFFQKH